MRLGILIRLGRLLVQLRLDHAPPAGAETVPFIIVGATDSRFFRQTGATCYGYGLFSERISFGELASMFHGDDERIDVESLGVTTQL